MKSKNNIFKFKKFDIKLCENVWKVGTDGVLLGAFVSNNNAKHILDIGTGSGLIALMIAQKSTAIIDAIDINEEAIELAKENINNSKWKEQINLFHSSLQEYNNSCKYDLIVTNPPYFSNGEISPNKARAMARHNIELNKQELAKKVSNLLSDDGKFALIFPNLEMEKFIELAKEEKLYLNKKIFVIPKFNYQAKRIIAFFQKNITSNVEIENITIEKEKRHDYTEEFIELTKEYYLNF